MLNTCTYTYCIKSLSDLSTHTPRKHLYFYGSSCDSVEGMAHPLRGVGCLISFGPSSTQVELSMCKTLNCKFVSLLPSGCESCKCSICSAKIIYVYLSETKKNHCKKNIMVSENIVIHICQNGSISVLQRRCMCLHYTLKKM